MRVVWLFAAALALSLPAAAYAVTPAADGLANSPRSTAIEQVVECGPHAHYVHGHRDHDGHYVKGHCVRERHDDHR
jgi:hypothetical protein